MFKIEKESEDFVYSRHDVMLAYEVVSLAISRILGSVELEEFEDLWIDSDSRGEIYSEVLDLCSDLAVALRIEVGKDFYGDVMDETDRIMTELFG